MIMLLASAFAITFQAALQPASEGKFECYPHYTQIGTVASRTFTDAAGHVTKEIFYTSDTLGCDPARLRVQQSRRYDKLDRELRHTKDAHVALTFDGDGRVTAIDGPLPDDVQYSLGWGDVVDGWSCGLGVYPVGAPLETRIAVHLRNHTDKDRLVWFTSFVETDLHDRSGRLLPLTQEFLARDHSIDPGRFGALLYPREARVISIDLQKRHGGLPPGRYTLTVRHPHPETAATLISNTLTFTVR